MSGCRGLSTDVDRLQALRGHGRVRCRARSRIDQMNASRSVADGGEIREVHQVVVDDDRRRRRRVFAHRLIAPAIRARRGKAPAAPSHSHSEQRVPALEHDHAVIGRQAGRIGNESRSHSAASGRRLRGGLKQVVLVPGNAKALRQRRRARSGHGERALIDDPSTPLREKRRG